MYTEKAIREAIQDRYDTEADSKRDAGADALARLYGLLHKETNKCYRRKYNGRKKIAYHQ